MIRLFTDGACKSNGKRGAQGSYAYYFPENPEWSGAFRIPETDSQTNNRGELLAIHAGVQKALEMTDASQAELHIFTDSTYSRDCLTKWIPGWLKTQWKTAAGKDVTHRDLIEETVMLLTKFKRHQISYVRAHTGGQDDLSKNNDIVDKMAVHVLIPEEVKVISTTDSLFPGMDFKMMGPPIDQDVITKWCLENLDKLDPKHLETALFMAFQKTVHKMGYHVESQLINKKKVARLTSKTNIVEGTTIIKKE
jgi:ribonuclease HI